jgi:aspartate aminotransferase
VVPGVAFGNDQTVRLSYAVGTDTLQNGLTRLADFCNRL